MKIVCENCATKYSIADEKVSGKVFKLRCKKCSHIIVVKGTTEADAAPPAATAASNGSQESAAPSEPAQPAAQESVWHLVIDREQVGPMTADEVRGKFAAGQIDAEAYIWREGFDDWVKLASVDDFRDLGGQQREGGGDDQATRRSATADLFRHAGGDEEPAPAADLFGGAMAGQDEVRTSSPNAATMMAGPGESFSPPISRGRSDEGMAVSSSGPAPGVEVKSMTGARSENSVLFSLNNLQALASGSGPSGASGSGAGPGSSSSPQAKPGYASAGSEGSGLIDIRAMAAATLSANSFSVGPMSSKPDELPLANDGPVFSPVAPAVLMPNAEPAGMPKWVWGVIGVGGVLVVGMVVAMISLLKSPPPPVPVAPVVVAANDPQVKPAGVQPPGPGPGETSPGAAKSPVKEPGKEPTPTAAAGDDEKKSRKGRDRDKDRGEKPAAAKKDVRESAAPVQAPQVVEAPAEVKKPKPSKPKDDLDSLLDSATGGASGGKPKSDSAKKDSPEQLSMDQIKSGLKGVNGAVQGCKEQFNSPGTYIVKITIGKNGRISDASVPGKSGDATADCVVRAVKGARFSEFTGDPQTLNYPFILR